MGHAQQISEAGRRSLGDDLRALRKSRGLTLSELALRLGRSVGWLSQVERGKSDISMSDLGRLAEVFEVPRGFFFVHDGAPDDERGYVVRAESRRVLGENSQGLTEELLSPDLGGEFEIFRSVFSAGAELEEFNQRETEEAGYVVSGNLDLWVGDRFFQVGPGDSFRFRNEPHRWRNSGDEAAVVIWVIAPPVY
ncbi:helix-turn-helix domain-containing protein [Coralliovum pocilloporae]|uniref:helix-turn-helix domain-containing protein n=1 Tax=Coralliovum pocilloporae TaxID=3066369 RepID=UPI003306E2DD